MKPYQEIIVCRFFTKYLWTLSLGGEMLRERFGHKARGYKAL
jgi:hypothetical protein